MADSDYKKIGLKVGLEIHQQLNSNEKLFCSCKTELFKENAEITFLRALRPTQSELGQIDPAAFFEFQKGVQILYEGNSDTACLVEMDEEPPHDLNREALESALTVSLMLEANPVDEIHVMRKTVIDGSNTTGFQRTILIALGGKVKIKTKDVPIEHVSLEEDAARKTTGKTENRKTLRYRIDRLGFPLVEVATAPVLYTPQECKDAALAIGRILRATGMARRGLGTIRQDLNISIRDGSLVEVKGVQELESVSDVVENEVKRQLNLLKIRAELAKRGAKEEEVKDKFIDVTHVFANTKCRVISAAIARSKQVLAVKLPKFEGILKEKLTQSVRLGTEMADRARFWGRTGGIFHTDELPAYGVTEEEVENLQHTTNAKPGDAIVFVADSPENAVDALRAVNERAKEALKKVPQETRTANPDASTRYMRPRPGAARMYPETDVSPIQIPRTYIEGLRKRLPELPEYKMQRLKQEYGLNEKLAKQILDSEFSQLFEDSVKRTKVSPTLAAVVLTETLKALQRKGTNVGEVSDVQLKELFHSLSLGKIVKEAVPDLIDWLAKHNKEAKVGDAVKALGLSLLSQNELEQIVDRLIRDNLSVLTQKKQRAKRLLVGLVMKRVRGRVKPESVDDAVKRKLRAFSEASSLKTSDSA